jgi:membrane protein
MLHALSGDAFQLPGPLRTLAQRVPALSCAIYFLWRISERLGKDQCPLQSAAKAFFGLFSVFPIVLAAVTILAQVLAVNRQVLDSFQNFVEEFFPGQTGNDISFQLQHAVASLSGSDTTTIGAVALLSLLWSGRAYFMTLATVLNDIWPQARPRSLLQQQIVLWTTFVGAGALWLFSTLISLLSSAALSFIRTFQTRLQRFDVGWLQPLLHSISLADVVSRLSSWLLTTLMFWLIYWFLPNVREGRSKRIVLLCAAAAAAAWEAFRILYAGFLGNMFNYAGVYGSSVAGVIATMMWIYFSSLILLLGAEAAAGYQETVAYLAERRAGGAKRVVQFVPEETNGK